MKQRGCLHLKQFICKTFFFFLVFFVFCFLDCYEHGNLVKTCYAIVRKRIFGMKLTEFVQEECVYEGTLINSGCHSDEKAVFVKV